MYYQLIDPLFFVSTFGMSLGGVIQSTVGVNKNSGNASQMAHVCGWISFVSFLFLVFNFQWMISAKRIKSLEKARKTFNAMYENGAEYRGNNISASMLFFAFMSFFAALLLFGLGVLVLVLANNNRIVNDDNEVRRLKDDEKMDAKTQIYFHILGWLTIVCSLIALLRLPLDYLLASMGIYWLLSILFY